MKSSAWIIACAALLLSVGTFSARLRAEEAAPSDEANDAAIMTEMQGAWLVKDQSGKKTCRVMLTGEAGIGGNAVTADPACAKVFPVMDEIATWRLGENVAIIMSDATRKMRIRFYTPDESYVAEPEVEGIFTIERAE